MLVHRHQTATAPNRVVVLGSRGFLGATLLSSLAAAGLTAEGISSRDVDLTGGGAADALAARLAPADALVVLAALTPDKGRGIDTFMANLRMMENVVGALAQSPVDHVVYISSDAVYALDQPRITEATCAAPTDLYGTMHKAREVMLASSLPADKLAILRLTLVYGAADTHNSYGPNRLRRMARDNGEIKLFGEGEETRDHILVDDAAALIGLALQHASHGTLNVATGRSISYMDLARLIAPHFDAPVKITCLDRQSPITYRQFDVTALHKAFPTFTSTPLEHGLALVHEEMMSGGGS